ncbi:hypothetical protein [Chamaesiphon sp. OTE_75_metabat_556]|uniref:hypothetical protein n=1 Tax=Chamaesiphon sp. OTE_75_metabat_556 TaxID=2964692 RepID=UPI00286B2B70|nr:hypothetical protein [Chamaesiphon sp. OTE_75_metabat_556]
MPSVKSPDWEIMNSLISNFDKEIYLNITSKYLNPTIRSICIPRNNAIDIYTGRANSPTRVMNGFDMLINNLKKLQDDSVFIHSVSTLKSNIIVFSDCDYIRILGVLALPDS